MRAARTPSRCSWTTRTRARSSKRSSNTCAALPFTCARLTVLVTRPFKHVCAALPSACARASRPLASSSSACTTAGEAHAHAAARAQVCNPAELVAKLLSAARLPTLAELARLVRCLDSVADVAGALEQARPAGAAREIVAFLGSWFDLAPRGALGVLRPGNEELDHLKSQFTALPGLLKQARRRPHAHAARACALVPGTPTPIDLMSPRALQQARVHGLGPLSNTAVGEQYQR